MLNAIYALCYLALLGLGTFLARRWLVVPPAAIRRYPRGLRIAALIFGCWIGCFVAASVANRIGAWFSDGIAYDGDAELPYEMLHDGVGNNALNLVAGWLLGFIAWGIASAITKNRTEQAGDRKPDHVPS